MADPQASTPIDLSGGFVSTQPTPANAAAPAVVPNTPGAATGPIDLSGGFVTPKTVKPPVTMPNARPSSAKEFDQAQAAGGYTETSEADGKPIMYLVQKPNESYPDFLKRAVAHGKTVTQEQMNEESNQPKKVLDAAIARPSEIAALSGAAMTGVNEIGGALGDFAIKHLAGNVLPGMEAEAAKQTLLNVVPKVIQFAKVAGEAGIGLGGITYMLKTLMGDKK